MRDRLDVALVAPVVAPLRRATPYGNHVVISDLGRELSRRGHAVTVYCARGSDPIEGVTLHEIDVAPEVRGAFSLLEPQRRPIAAMRDAFERLFTAVRSAGHDVVSQHAFDAEAIDAAEGLRVLHTLHLPPIVPRVVRAARATRDALATVSVAMQRAWLDAGVATIVAPNGVPDREVPRASNGSRSSRGASRPKRARRPGSGSRGAPASRHWWSASPTTARTTTNPCGRCSERRRSALP